MNSKYTIYQGSCIDVMDAMTPGTVDLILTDPPYNLGKFMKERATNLKRMRSNYFGAAGWDDLDYKTWTESMDKFFERASRVIRPGGSMIVFMAIIKVETIIQLAKAKAKGRLFYQNSRPFMVEHNTQYPNTR